MSCFGTKIVVVFCSLVVASMVVTVRAETAPPVQVPVQVVASATLDRQQLKNELEELEAEVERVRRTQGEGGLHRRGLKQKLEEKKSMIGFHLQLIDRLEQIEQRLSALEARTGGR